MDGWMDIISYPIKTTTIHWFRLPLFRVKVFSQVRWHPGRNHRAEGREPNGGTLGSTPVRATIYIYNHCICTHIYTHIYMYVYIYIYVYMCVYIYIFINYLIYDSYICTYICLTYKIYIHRLRSWIVPVLFFWGDAAHQRTYAGRGQGRVAMGIPNFWPIAMSQKSVDSPFTVP